MTAKTHATPLGHALHIQDALLEAGVTRELIWPNETGSVNVHDANREIVDVTIGKSGGPSWEYTARDTIRDCELAKGNLSFVAGHVAQYVKAALAQQLRNR